MSKSWPWLGWGVVLILSEVSILTDLQLNRGKGVGSILILSATALVIVWYANETRKMAKSTRELAAASLRPGLIIYCPDVPKARFYTAAEAHELYAAQTRTKSRIINKGPGPAFAIHIGAGDMGFRAAEILPPGGTAYHEILEDARRDRQAVSLSYTDLLGNGHHFSSWRYEPAIRQWRATREDEDDAFIRDGED